MPSEIFSGEWLISWPVARGELLCRLNWSLCRLFFVHSFSSDSANAIIINKKSTGAMLSPCLTPTLNGIVVSILPIISLTTLFLYIRAIADCRLGGQPYFSKIRTISLW